MSLPSVAEQRRALKMTTFDAGRKHRILFLGNLSRGSTDIVASMGRALENVGHTVFQLNTAQHPGLLDASSGAQGGYGPILVRLEYLRTVLDTFRPEVLVCCAGGMVLDQPGQAELRRRGIVSVGITLSDPDVQPSVIDHVARFDYHTTNAQLALERYEAAGVRNTFLFPFGIDRDYVLRDVADDPSLRADAICIGHAHGRVDRHAVMEALAKHVDVKVYGNGWPFIDARPVSGDRLLQAARAGTFHVNFAATRAGYTNVKCGVFESIGAGGVLCTARFEEMGRLFEYGTEIIGYEDAEDLAQTIAALKQEPEKLEQMRRRAFHRLLSEHLYEHRWLTLFSQIYEDVASAEPRVGPERAAAIRRALETEHVRPRVVLVSGYFGTRNRGDDILLDAVAGRIERDVPDALVVVGSTAPAVVESAQGRPAFRRTAPHEADYWAARATSVIVGPGGLWHDYTIQRAQGVVGVVTGATVSPAHLVQLPAMVRAHGGTYHAFGLGVGPLTDPAAQATVRLHGVLAETVVVRDEESAQLLRQIPGWSPQPRVSPDIAYSLPLPEPSDRQGSPPYLAVSVRPWDRAPGTSAAVLDGALAVGRRHGLKLLIVPMQPADVTEAKEWLGARDGVESDVSILPHDSSNQEFVDALAGARAVVAMRLHTNLIAHRLARPCVGIAYDPKVREHFRQLGREELVIELPVDAATLERLIETALEERRLSDTAVEAIQNNEHAVDQVLAELTRRLASTPRRAAAPGILPQDPPRVRTLNVPGWDPNHALPLTAKVSGGNLTDPAREVPVRRRKKVGYDRFGMDVSGPRKGDYAAWTMTVPTTPGQAQRLELWLRSTYAEKPARLRRLAYEVLLDGRRLFRHDVANWSQRNTVWIAHEPTTDTVALEVRLIALRDLPDWNWGRAANIVVEAIRAMPWTGGASLVWQASSPFTEAVTPPDGAHGISSGGREASAPRMSARSVVGRARRALRRSFTRR